MQLSLNRKASQNDLIHSFVVTVSEPIRYSLQFRNALINKRFGVMECRKLVTLSKITIA